MDSTFVSPSIVVVNVESVVVAVAVVVTTEITFKLVPSFPLPDEVSESFTDSELRTN